MHSQALRVSSYLSLIRLDGLLFCGGSATWRCSVHTNEPLPGRVRAYGWGSWRVDGETRVGKARGRPPLTGADNETEGAGEGEKAEGGGDDGVREAQRWLVFFIYFCPPLLVNSFPSPHRQGRSRFVSLLCCYQEIIICCSVFHTENQGHREQQDKSPHGGFTKKIARRPLFTMHFQ